MRGISGIVVVFSCLLFFSACELYDPAEDIPSYIRIPSISVSVSDSTINGQGSSSSKINDAWIYIDGKLLGGFELPCTVPVLAEGNHEITIDAGIKSSGFETIRKIYPFFKSYKASHTLKRGEILTIKPTVSYYSNVKFELIEDFEQVGVTISKSVNSDTSLLRTQVASEVFEGKSSGVVYLDWNKTFFEAVSPSYYNLPKTSPNYVEINYKSNAIFAVGLYVTGSPDPIPALLIKPSTEWNKLYVNLTDYVSYTAGTGFALFIAMNKPDDVNDPVLYLDNIKLVHF